MKKIKKPFKFITSFIKTHKVLSVIGLVLIVGLVFIFKPKPAAVLETQEVKYGNITQTVSVNGNITSQSIANLSFQSGGKLVYLVGKVGENVFAGQIIASLDKTKLQANLRQYQQDFNAAKAAVEQVYDQTKRASDLNFAQKVSQTSAEATQNKSYDNIKIVEQQLRDADLVSPINGTIVKEDVSVVGSNVSVTNVFTVADPNNLYFQMEVDEADIAKVKIGQQVKITLDSFPDETITTTVQSIDFVSHTTSTGGNAYTVKSNLISNGLALKVGMNGDVDIIINEKKNVLVIPSSAIFDDNKVYVKTKTGTTQKTIELGLQSDTDTEVISGLSQGDLVILQPSLVVKK